jgi:hypothetical protein
MYLYQWDTSNASGVTDAPRSAHEHASAELTAGSVATVELVEKHHWQPGYTQTGIKASCRMVDGRPLWSFSGSHAKMRPLRKLASGQS